MTQLSDLAVKIFADGASLERIAELTRDPLVQGFTTNPTLMRKAGVTDYRAFAYEAIELVSQQPISFEVFADDQAGMWRQALEISSWADNVFVKIPFANTKAAPSYDLLRSLAAEGVRVNATAMMTVEQIRRAAEALADGPAGFVSLFAGRIADTGRDPVPMIEEAVALLRDYANLELIWASPREVLNVIQADVAGCHVITVTDDLLAKLHLVGKDIEQFSQETVQMFFDDAAAAGYTLDRAGADLLADE